jgi:hypothetical protein
MGWYGKSQELDADEDDAEEDPEEGLGKKELDDPLALLEDALPLPPAGGGKGWGKGGLGMTAPPWGKGGLGMKAPPPPHEHPHPAANVARDVR